MPTINCPNAYIFGILHLLIIFYNIFLLGRPKSDVFLIVQYNELLVLCGFIRCKGDNMLKLVYSNNMLHMAMHLAEIQRSKPLPPLEAETVIVQSNELARWLSLFLAQHHGIASHIEFPYPSAYLWALFRKVLPNIPTQSPYSTEAMAWRIYDLLPATRLQAGFESIDVYLGQQDDPLKRYALAHRIADSFDQYLMYRPDWIQAWEQGENPHWQAMLWQQLTAGDAKPLHRANLLDDLYQYLATTTQRHAHLPSRIAIFGLTALPPVYMDLFNMMARHCELTLYFLSPSEHYWGDLLTLKKKAERIIAAPEQEDYLHTGHPLLASLGKQGQAFFEQIQDYQPEEEALFMPPQANHLLGKVQEAIYNLTEVDETEEKIAIAVEDDSIRVHACHSAMREIEVLHDQLLALFERHPDLSPTDIVVMTPDIELYTPWIDAVFGCAPEKQRIAYGITDAGVAIQSPVISAFISLLGLPQSRFDVDTIMTLLECSAIQRRFAIQSDQLELIRRWIAETNTRWGLSAADKTELGLPAMEANTWRAGLDRLLLGYAMPLSNADNEWHLFEGKLGFDGISGERAETMAQLCSFVDRLDRYRQRLKGAFDAKGWQQQLLSLIDDLFLVSNERSQNSEEAELVMIRKTIDSLVETTDLAHFEKTMHIDLVKDWLNGHLDSNQTQSHFMGHGVTFCGMVPMRSIPFAVVCLIGMNDGSYPRRQPTAGFDLLSTTPARKGDRSRREDDRYLFLEAILSAQDHLYISYVGASITDNADIPPSVLVSDLRDVLQQSYQTENGQDIWQQILTRHPLQAFSRRYFDQQSPQLFSYVSAHCPPDKKMSRSPSWFEQPLPEADESWRQVSLSQLLAFFRHPARFCMQQRLGVYLSTEDDQLETREPFELDGLQAWQLRQQLLDFRMQDTALTQVLNVVQATGVLPQGQVGEQVFTNQLEQVEEFANKLLPEYPADFMTPIAFELSLGKFCVTGQLDHVSPEGLFNYRMGKTKGDQVLTVWIQHLILNCLQPANIKNESRLITENNTYHWYAVTDAPALLQALLDLYWQGLHQPIPLFANTSFAFAQANFKGNSTDCAVNAAWSGNMKISGEGEDLYYQQLYSAPPLDEQFEQLALAVYQPVQTHLAEGKL